MANGPLLRVSNVLGTPVFQWVINQLGTRAENNSKDTRDDSNLIYLANKTGWFRIVSSVRTPEQDYNKQNSKTYKYFKDLYPNDIKDQDSLAKKFVLFAGTSAYEKPDQTKSDFSYKLRENAYGILGDAEIKAYGRRPMPGITSVQIDTQGSLGSIRSAVINFKVWDKAQLDIIDALYFKLGYTMFLEWGNTFYYKTGNSTLYKSEDLQIDPFSSKLTTKEQINLQIQNKIRESEGNYDGMLGLVTNFNFTFNQEGGYDCTLKIQALGSLGDSIKINHSSALPALYVRKVEKAVNDDYQQKLEEAKKQKDLDFQNKTKELVDQINKAKDALSREQRDPLILLLSQYGPEGWAEEDEDTKELIYPTKHSIPDYLGQESIGISVSKNKDILFIPYNSRGQRIDKYLDGSQGQSIVVTLDRDRMASTFSENISNYNTRERAKGGTTNYLAYNFFDYLYFIGGKDSYTSQNQEGFDIIMDPVSRSVAGFMQSSNLSFNVIGVAYRHYSYKKDEVAILLSLVSDPSIKLTIEDTSLIQDISYTDGFNNLLYSANQKIIDANTAAIAAIQKQTENDYNVKLQDLSKENAEATVKQTEDATNYQSALEIMLKIIQLESFNYAKNSGFSDVVKYDLTSKDTQSKKIFIDELFSEGIFEGKIQKLLEKVKELDSAKSAATTDQSKLDLNKNYTNKGQDEQFLINAAFGFNHNFMAGISDVATTPLVKYKSVSANDHTLFNSYILPQNVKSKINEGSIDLNHPVYIPFGLLLMMVNHICLIYDGTSRSQLTPIVYVDYNTNTNFCLTNAKQLSTDISKFLIGFQGSNESYQELFDKDVLTSDKKKLIKTDKSQAINIFTPQSQDSISGKIPEFKTVGKTAYQGRLMNVLVNVNYLTKLVSEFSYRDGTNSVYLKQFLEQILVDMNKSLGNFNMLRLSYHDPSNAFVIVDDQQTKVVDGEIQLSAQNANISEIPIFGKKSIARSVELRTDISSKLGSMIAISANADPSRQVSLSTDASSFGFVNTDFQDRFISISTDIYMEKKQQNSTKNSAIVNEAKMFDEYIRSIYQYADSYDETKISFATNYFIQKMSVLKNKEIATRASAMIPVSLNISIDGISGFQMTQLFTIGDNFLPYNYTKVKEGNPFTNVGFAIVGLTHTIENNQWITSLRTNMSYLRNSVNDYEADKTRTEYANVKPARLSPSVGGQNNDGNQQTTFVASGNLSDEAKNNAITYLGSNILDTDWNQLVSATGAEADVPRNTKEVAWILGTILNRVRLGIGGDSVYDVLHSPNQYQAVTGTSANNRTASNSYIAGPTDAETIYKAIIAELQNVPKDYVNFTSNDPNAYKDGTNINYLYELRNDPSNVVYGGTIFTKK